MTRTPSPRFQDRPDCSGRPCRPGLTLIEILIAIAILMIAASIIYPIVFRDTPATSPVSEADVIEQAKALAITRAEPLEVRIQQDGIWAIIVPADASTLATGQLVEAPHKPFALRVTELGACLPAPHARYEGVEVDAVSCTVRR